VLKFAELSTDLRNNLPKAALCRRVPPAGVKPRISPLEFLRGHAYGVDGVLSLGMVLQSTQMRPSRRVRTFGLPARRSVQGGLTSSAHIANNLTCRPPRSLS
jgi:hypothetical protein